MRTAITRLFLVSVCLMMLMSCGSGVDSYCPLKEGSTWEYKFTGELPTGQSQSRKITITNQGARDLKGKKVTPRKMDFGGRISTVFILSDETGIIEYAGQRQEEAEPELRKEKIFLLKNPLKVGTAWENQVTSAMLPERTTFTVKYSIVSLDDDVTVPAGSFKKCVRVKGTGEAKLDDVLPVTVEVNRWYAPGVGVVRSISKETVVDGGTGTVTQLLESYKK